MLPEIPTDIWRHIASFIPPNELQKLYSVNRVFLQLVLDKRYREVGFLQVDSRSLRLLERVCDPNIASRVRCLRLDPIWFQLSSSPATRTIIRRLRSEFKQQSPPLKNDISTTLLFPNITSFVLIARQVPYPPMLGPFLTNAWRTFGPGLTRLTLYAPLAAFVLLLPTPTPTTLPVLTELTLIFGTDLTSIDPARDTHVLTHTIAPFLHALAPHLRRLTITSSALGDHTPLFASLPHTPAAFPHLTTLSLDIGFYPPLLSDPAALTALLQHHAPALKHVRFQPHRSVRAPAYAEFTTWMRGAAAGPSVLAGLESLVVAPAQAFEAAVGGVLGLGSVGGPGIDLGAVGPYLLRSKDTLTSLVLGDRCLSFAELTALARLVAHSGLKILYMELLSLSPQVFDVLAERLPGLEDLDIKFKALLADAAHERVGGPGHKAPDMADVAAFLAGMEGRVYAGWALEGLWIWQRSGMTTRMALQILKRLRSSIPAIKMVGGMDRGRHLNSIFTHTCGLGGL